MARVNSAHGYLQEATNGMRLHLKKLVPGEAWPQVNAADAAPQLADAQTNALQERQAVEALLKAAQDGDVEAFTSSARHFGGSELSSIKDGNERTALHFAAASGKAGMCRYLLAEAGFPRNAQDAAGEGGPMHLVAMPSGAWIVVNHSRGFIRTGRSAGISCHAVQARRHWVSPREQQVWPV